jgi:hypothetical protein
MDSEQPLRVGLCGIGLDAYWSQFAGLESGWRAMWRRWRRG